MDTIYKAAEAANSGAVKKACTTWGCTPTDLAELGLRTGEAAFNTGSV